MRTLSTLREPPFNVLEAVREVDPTADLLYLAFGQWVLGSVRPSTYSTRLAHQLLVSFEELPALAKHPGRYRWLRLVEAGFRPVQVYSEQDVHSGRLVLDFRLRDWNYRNRRDEAFREAAARIDSDRRVEQNVTKILDMVDTTFESAMRFARGRRGVLNPGLN